MPDRSERWPGGYVYRDKKGRPAYVIYRKVSGDLFEVSTRSHSLRAAMKHLERFEASPTAYDPAGMPDPVYLSKDLAQRFLDWSRIKKKNSRGWRSKQKRYLDWWQAKIGRRDLRSLSAEEIAQALKDTPAEHHRTAVIKTLYSWLRTVERRIRPADDPTFGTIKVPQGEPEQRRRIKAVTLERFHAMREHIVGHYADCMDVLSATGWHVTELQRFARGGTLEPYRGPLRDVAGVLVCPHAKGGGPVKVAVSAGGLEAAKRLLKHGAFSREWLDRTVRNACKAAQIEPFTPGVMRHTVATWAINQGADPAAVAGFLNHKSQRTTREFYATHAVPGKVPTLL